MPPADIQLAIFTLTFVATFLLPLINAVLLLKMKQISSLEMKTKEERKIPYLATAVFYFAESYFLMRSDVSVMIKLLMFGATLLVVAIMVINLFWKISAHTAGIGGLTGMMIFFSWRLQMDVLPLLMFLFFIAGIISYARLKLSAHSPAQVYFGFFAGLFTEMIFFYPEIFR